MRIDFIKPPLTFDEQILLLSERGLLITDMVEAHETLRTINYYRLRGYNIHLYDSIAEKFFKGITLHQIRMIHDFDMHLLRITANFLMLIEIAFKTQIAYCHAHSYGGLGYLHSDNFKDRRGFDDFFALLSCCQ
jgi:abortive infection bacteriophage resistance protein